MRSDAHVCREFAALLGGLAEEGRRAIRIRGRGDARREMDDNNEQEEDSVRRVEGGAMAMRLRHVSNHVFHRGRLVRTRCSA